VAPPAWPARVGLAAVDVELLDLAVERSWSMKLVTVSRARSSRIWSASSSNVGGGAWRRSSILMTVIAELRLDRRSLSSPFFSANGGVGEFLDHVGALEPAEIAASAPDALSVDFVLGELLERAPFFSSAIRSFASCSVATRMWRARTSSSAASTSASPGSAAAASPA
jgi:hypothetical protein